MADSDACDWCEDPVRDALARTVRLSVDRSQIDAQRLCPDCFADWVARYGREMEPDGPAFDEDADIIVD